MLIILVYKIFIQLWITDKSEWKEKIFRERGSSRDFEPFSLLGHRKCMLSENMLQLLSR